jgi:hypothetical protein
MMPMMKYPHGEGGCEYSMFAASFEQLPSASTPTPLLNRFEFWSTRPNTELRRGDTRHGD